MKQYQFYIIVGVLFLILGKIESPSILEVAIANLISCLAGIILCVVGGIGLYNDPIRDSS